MGGFQFFPVMFSTKLWSAFIVRRFSQNADQNPANVYHYTTGEGLKGIVENKALWATAAYYLNDTSEIDYGCELAAEQLLDKAKHSDEKFVRAALESAIDRLLIPGQRELRLLSLYVACFCESGNLLSQWRAYSGSGGFALGFGQSVQHMKSEGMTVSPLQKVLYERQIQVRRVVDLIEEIVTIFQDNDVCRGETSGPSQEDVAYASGEIAQVLLATVVCFKAPDFAEEQEWRLVCQPQFAEDSEKTKAIRRVVKFRASSRGLIPYVELRDQRGEGNAPFPLESVRFGPTQRPDLVRSATRMLLDSRGFASTEVMGSEIPVILGQ
jgi:hypothetical protein